MDTGQNQREVHQNTNKMKVHCRLCGKSFSKGETQPLFSSNGRDIVELLQKYLGVRIHRGDALPKQICKHCLIMFLRYKSYVNNIFSVQMRLQNSTIKVNAKNDYIPCPLCYSGIMEVKDKPTKATNDGPGVSEPEQNIDDDCLLRMFRHDAGVEKRDTGPPFACFMCNEGFNSAKEFPSHVCKSILPPPEEQREEQPAPNPPQQETPQVVEPPSKVSQ